MEGEEKEELEKALQSGSYIVCLEGESGTGKSHIVKELGLRCVHVTFGGDSDDKSFRFVYEQALQRNEKTVLVIDDAERWLGEHGSSELLLTLVDIIGSLQLQGDCLVTLLLVTREVRKLHPFLASKIDQVLRMDIPSSRKRKVVWEACVKQYLGVTLPSEGIEQLDLNCNGWVFSDISHACHSVDRTEDTVRTLADLIAFAETYEPFLFKGKTGSCPWKLVSPHQLETTWESIGGLESTKQALKEMIVWPTLYREKFEQLGISKPSGLLLYGPPGTGKTLLASAVAHETNANFLSVSISDIVRGYVGESEKAIAQVFALARKVCPCVLFFDEFQALFGSRENSGEFGRKLISQLVIELDNKADGLILLASTNMPEAIDSALLRPGRFDRKVEVPLPDENGRRMILKRRQEKGRWADEVDCDWLVEVTSGWSGAEIDAMCSRAALLAVENEQQQVCKDFFCQAMDM